VDLAQPILDLMDANSYTLISIMIAKILRLLTMLDSQLFKHLVEMQTVNVSLEPCQLALVLVQQVSVSNIVAVVQDQELLLKSKSDLNQ